jgi:hypothetical protein
MRLLHSDTFKFGLYAGAVAGATTFLCFAGTMARDPSPFPWRGALLILLLCAAWSAAAGFVGGMVAWRLCGGAAPLRSSLRVAAVAAVVFWPSLVTIVLASFLATSGISIFPIVRQLGAAWGASLWIVWAIGFLPASFIFAFPVALLFTAIWPSVRQR